MSEKLIITRNRVVAKQSRREGVYNRTGDLSVICFGEEEQRNECEAIKNRRKRYVACDDVAGVAESDKASLVACNNFMSLLLRKRWTVGSNPAKKLNKKTADTKLCLLFLAGVAGFEPTNAAVKVLCLTA